MTSGRTVQASFRCPHIDPNFANLAPTRHPSAYHSTERHDPAEEGEAEGHERKNIRQVLSDGSALGRLRR